MTAYKRIIEENKLYGDKRGDELPPELNTQQKIREKLKEIEQASNRKLKSAAKLDKAEGNLG